MKPNALANPASDRHGFLDVKRLVSPILPGRHAEPAAARLVETAVVMEAKEISHMFHVEMRVAQVKVRQLPAHGVLHVLELRAVLLQGPLQRAC